MWAIVVALCYIYNLSNCICVSNINDPASLIVLQGVITSASEFTEESLPIPVAVSFSLVDFDSLGVTPRAQFTVVVTLSGAVDDQDEGILFDTSGTDVQVAPPTQPERFVTSYTLQGSDNYTMYQSVSKISMALSPPFLLLPSFSLSPPLSPHHSLPLPLFSPSPSLSLPHSLFISPSYPPLPPPRPTHCALTSSNSETCPL